MNEYIYTPIDFSLYKNLLKFNKNYIKELKCEFILGSLSKRDLYELLDFIDENGIKIYSLRILKYGFVDYKNSEIFINRLKKHPIERVVFNRVVIDNRQIYYNFMKFLHSIETLDCLIIDVEIKYEENNGEVYEPITRSRIKKIKMHKYTEFVLERSVMRDTERSLDLLDIDLKIFQYCDLSQYIDRVKKLRVFSYSFEVVSSETYDNFVKFISRVSGVEELNYECYCNIQDSFFDFLNSNKNLKILSVREDGTCEYMLRMIGMTGIVLDELHLDINKYFVSVDIDKSRIARNIIYKGVRHATDKHLNYGIKPLSLVSDTKISDFRNITSIKNIVFSYKVLDFYYELLKRPENNVKEIEIELFIDFIEKLLYSLESEHCKVNRLTILSMSVSNPNSANECVEILRILHKKLEYLKVEFEGYITEDENREIVNYLIDSNIEHLIIRSRKSSFEITTQDLAKLIIKTKEITISDIVLIDDDDIVKVFSYILLYVKDGYVLNEKFNISLKNGTCIYSKSDIYNSYSYNLLIITTMYKFRHYVERLKNNNESVEDDLIMNVMNLPSDITNEILNRLN